MFSKKILLVEDDSALLSVLKYNLEKEGYTVLTASDGSEGLNIARSDRPDLIVLDVMLPVLSGFEVCRIIRKELTVPIMMLTAKTEEIDRIVGLEIGADDYVTKPFSMRELMARIRAMLRRAEVTPPAAEQQILRLDDLSIDTSRHQTILNGVGLELTPKEFELLVFLARNKGFVFSREQLLEKVWGYDFAGDTRTVDVHIRWLRQKMEADPSHPKRLVTVRGTGYKFEG